MSRIYSVGNTRTTFIELDDGLNTCILVSVNLEREKDIFNACNKVVRFEYGEGFPFSINYENPEDAGVDRVAFATFLYYEGIYPAYLIDAGTFITVDFFDGKRLYPILTSPGFSLLSGLLKRGFNLKNLEPRPFSTHYPKNPKESLYSGIYTVIGRGIGTFFENEGEIIITGGDAPLLRDLIKKGIILEHAVHLGAYHAFSNGLIK